MLNQRSRIQRISLALSLLVSGIGLAQTTRPATAPTSAPSALRPPRGAIRMLGSARFSTPETINGLSLSPDGTYLITTHSAALTRLWETQSGNLLLEFPNSTGGASVSFVGGDRVIVGGVTAGLRLFNARTGELIRSTLEPQNPRLVVGSPDGTRIAVVSTKIELLNPADLSVVADLGTVEQIAPALRGRSVMFSIDSRLLLTVGNDGALRLSNAATGAAVEMSDRIPATTRNLAALSPDGSRVAIFDTGPRAFDVKTGEEIVPPKVELPPDNVTIVTPTLLDFARGNDALVIASTSRSQVIDLQTGRKTLDQALGQRATVSRDGMKLAISAGRSAHVFDTTSGKPIHPDDGHLTRVTAVAASPDGQSVVSADANGMTIRWDVRSGLVRAVARTDRPRSIERMAYSSDGKLVCILPVGARPILLDGFNFAPRERGEQAPPQPAARAGQALSPDLSMIAGGTTQRAVLISNPLSGELIASIPPGNGGGLIDSIAFSPNGKSLAVSDAAKRIRIFRIPDVEPVLTIDDVARSGPSRIIWSPEGNVLARGDSATVTLFDLAGGKEIARIAVPNMQNAAFSPDGLLLAIGRQNEVLVFDGVSGARLARMAATNPQPFVLTFVGSSSLLAVGDPDGRVPIFDLALLLRTPQLQALKTEELVERLRSTNASQAIPAGAELLGRPETLLELAKTVATADPSQQYNRLVQQLSSPDSATREKAHLALERAGKAAAPAIAAALANPPPGEAGARLQSLARVINIDPLASATPPASEFTRRVVMLLEWLGDDRARAALKEITDSGDPSAANALARLDARRAAATQPTTQP